MNQHILLSDIGISEKIECIYAQIIAEEDIRESYGQETIVQKRLHISGQHTV